MHPAPSVIAFTTLSGAGFGLLAWLGLGLARAGGLGGLRALRARLRCWRRAGLLASTLHLGHPSGRCLAFTQWRSSWLSREAWTSVATLVVMALYGAGLVFFGTALWPARAGSARLLALATLVSTSMIYAQLQTVPRWRHWSTPALFLALALAGGAIFAGQRLRRAAAAGDRRHAADLRLRRRRRPLRPRPARRSSTATGLPGRVRAFEPPHTGPNYLLREMVYRVGRRRASQLRLICLALGFGLPIVLLALLGRPPRPAASPGSSTFRASPPGAGCSSPRPSMWSASTTARRP